ncbi:hypothetical protein KSU1_D0531 [Candidatus Jettenia caeni]|uniref:CRISPR-associated protein n=2 Tax=Candidatus Jettenia TaxID=360731 RepID=I3IQ45_9BACT|nr:hypothetical protein KSU1_D0531 [Candidatus Jettenia caeni]
MLCVIGDYMTQLQAQQTNNNFTGIVFKKTGNFWIDNGIVGLYSILISHQAHFEQLFGIQLSPLETDTLIVGVNQKCTDSFFAELKRLLIESFVYETNNYGFYYDQASNRFVLSRKRDLRIDKKYYFQGFVPKPDGKIPLKGLSVSVHKELENFLVKNKTYKLSIENEIPTSKMIFALSNKTIVNSDMLRPGRKPCSFCGDRFKKLISLDRMHFPLLVGFPNLKTFYSNLDSEFRLCGKCSLAALAGSYKSYFSIHNAYLSCFILYDPDLSEMYRLQSEVGALTGNPYGNFDKQSVITTYLYETLFVFLLSLFEKLRCDSKQEWFNRITAKKIIGILALKQGNTVIVEHMVEFSRITELFVFFEKSRNLPLIGRGKKEAIEWTAFLNALYSKTDENSVLRNHICERILNFTKTNDLLEEYLFRSERTNKNLFYFIRLYNKEVAGMEESMIALCAAIGGEIGRKSKAKDTKGFLYAIRNCRCQSEFIKILSQIQFPLEISYNRNLFDSLREENWEDYKSLISIFAANQFFYNPKKEDAENE